MNDKRKMKSSSSITRSPLALLGLAAPLTAVGVLAFSWTGLGWLAPPAAAQQSVRTADDHAGVRQLAPVQDLDGLRDELTEQLSTRDLDARERHFDDLARRLGTEPGLRRAVEDFATGTSGDLELTWTARLLLREADRVQLAGPGHDFRAQDPHGGRGRMPVPSPFASRDPFEEMRQRMNEMMSRDPFFSAPNSRRGFSGLDPLEDARRRIEELQRRDPFFGPGHDLRRQLDSLFQGGVTAPGTQSRSQSMQMKSGPDGVRVEITQDDGSGQSTKVYEAESMEELLRLHPEISDSQGGIRLDSPVEWGEPGEPGTEDKPQGEVPPAEEADPSVIRPLRPRRDR